jgi:hypothetical protein
LSKANLTRLSRQAFYLSIGILLVACHTSSPVSTENSSIKLQNVAQSTKHILDVGSVIYEPGENVTTFAGNGAGYVDGPGAIAQFVEPYAEAIDASDNIYVTDGQYFHIRKISPTGSVSTFATNGPGAIPQGPSGYGIAIAADLKGNVYTVNGAHVVKIDSTGYANILAGADVWGDVDGLGATARFDGIAAIAINASSELYVADFNNHSVRKISPAGYVSTVAGGISGYADGPGSTAQFIGPDYIAVDASGNIFAADRVTIRKVNPAGYVTTLAGINGVSGHVDGPVATAQFDGIGGITVDASDNVFVSDNDCIRKITPAGYVTTLAGEVNGVAGYKDGAGATAQFDRPSGVAVDSKGNLYVADYGNNRIRKISGGSFLSLISSELAFSPNNDGVKDADILTIASSSSQKWTLSVDGQGTIQTGTGNASVNWDGKINGAALPDGQYMVRLHADVSSDQTASIIIDTKPPTVGNVDISPDSVDPTGNSYKVTATINDVGLSGIDPKSLGVNLIDGAANSNITIANFDPNNGLLASADFGLPSSGIAAAYHIASVLDEPAVAIAVSDRAGNKTTFKQAIPSVSLNLSLSKEKVRPLLDREYTYASYADAMVTVKAFVVDQQGHPKANVAVQFDSTRVANTGGHNHPDGPTGQFSNTTSGFPMVTRNQRYVGKTTYMGKATSDQNGVAQIYYLPYGFSGTETIKSRILKSGMPMDSTEKSKDLVIAYGAFVKFNPGAYGSNSVDSHPEGIYGTQTTVDDIGSLFKNYYEKTHHTLIDDGISLPDGGPFDIFHTWGFTHADGNQHKSHRNGVASDTDRLTSGGTIRWDDRTIRKAIRLTGGSDPLDESNGSPLSNTHFHVTWH